jgi:glutathione peroxidase
LTAKNYQELQELYVKYSDKGFEILAFPCNNFGGQEPGTNAEVLAFAKGKGATFPILGKVECENGDATVPIYKWLKSTKKGPLGVESLMWNFAKFLCDKDGQIVERYAPTSSPLSFEKDIVKLLNRK